MSKLILTIICIIALNNFIVVTPAIADANMRRLCLYDYNAGEDWISIRWGDAVRLTVLAENSFDPSSSPVSCFFATAQNWWMSITQDARITSSSQTLLKMYNNVQNPNERFIDRLYWHINTQLETNNAVIGTSITQNFVLPLVGTGQRPAATNLDREINNYFLSFFPAYPSMNHRLSYVLSGIEQDNEGNTSMQCGTGPNGELYPHFKANLKLYGSKESALKAFNLLDVAATSTTIKRNIWYDHTTKTLYPALSAAGEDYSTSAIYIKTALCVQYETSTVYSIAYVVHWWTGTFKTGQDKTPKEAGFTTTNLCAATSTSKAALCTTTPAAW